MPSATLQRVLVAPFVLLILALAGVIYWTSYRSSENAGHELSKTILVNMVDRVNRETERNLAGAHIAVNTILPNPIYSPVDGVTSPVDLSATLDAVEQRLWIATGFFPKVNNYVYFGSPNGEFVGINRRPDRIELRLRSSSTAEREVFSVAGPGKRHGLVRKDYYDPRTRPWFKTAVANGRVSWTSVYTDFTTLEPTFTLSKPAYGVNGDLIGVAGTDFSLTQLAKFFKSLTISENGVAFIVERSGAIIATSTDERPFRIEENALLRLMANESTSLLLRQAYRQIVAWQKMGEKMERPVSREFESELGIVQIGATMMRDPAGLEWITIVAIPRTDFIGNFTTVFYQSLMIGLLAAVVVLILGSALLHWVLRDIRKLTHAAENVVLGRPLRSINIQRTDEIGLLAKSFQEMERNLRTDKLTGVLNRESFIAQIEFRCRNTTDFMPLKFSLLFLDLDRFKQINDQYGHDAGDRVLIEVARRLRSALRTEDEVARFGGDEFVVYLNGIDSTIDIVSVCNKLIDVIREQIQITSDTFGHVGSSIGWALYPNDGIDVDTLLKVADTRMYECKNLHPSN